MKLSAARRAGGCCTSREMILCVLANTRSEFEIIGYGWDRDSKDRCLQGFDLPVICDKEDGVGVISSQYIVDRYGPEAVCQFILPVVSFDIESEIEPVIIGYTGLVAVAVHHVIGIVESIGPHGIGYRTPGLVGKVHGNAVPAGELIITDQAKVMRLIKISREKVPPVDLFFKTVPIKLVESPGKRIAEPTVEVS